MAKFADFMVKDLKNGNPHRADKLIEDAMEKVMQKKAKKMQIKGQNLNSYASEKSRAMLEYSSLRKVPPPLARTANLSDKSQQIIGQICLLGIWRRRPIVGLRTPMVTT